VQQLPTTAQPGPNPIPAGVGTPTPLTATVQAHCTASPQTVSIADVTLYGLPFNGTINVSTVSVEVFGGQASPLPNPVDGLDFCSMSTVGVSTTSTVPAFSAVVRVIHD
jgi:hypothetical protein